MRFHGRLRRLPMSLRSAPRALQEAFRACTGYPQYLSDAAELKLDASPIDGDEILRAIDAMAGAPPEFLEYARKLFAETKGGG